LRSGRLEGGRLIVLLTLAMLGFSCHDASSTLASFPEGRPLDKARSARLDSDASRIPERGRAKLLLRAYAEAGRRTSLAECKLRLSGSANERCPHEDRLTIRDGSAVW